MWRRRVENHPEVTDHANFKVSKALWDKEVELAEVSRVETVATYPEKK